MLRLLVFLCVVHATIQKPGPKYPPSKGEVWPKPQNETKGKTIFSFNPAKFPITVNNNCTFLYNAILRYLSDMDIDVVGPPKSMRRRRRDVTPRESHDPVKNLHVQLTQPCQVDPYFGMDESYNLTVAATCTITSASVWGIFRGLETLSQLFYMSDDYSEMLIQETAIVDFPRYPHRGLMLDTSRHHISTQNILMILDGMMMNKMNVFHWHIIDDESYPYQSEKFPDLSEKGAYYPTLIYSKADIEMIVQYAKDRGIRVVPEFDVPGHTSSYGISHPEILTNCSDHLGPMNPIKNETYTFLEQLFKEAQGRFSDKYFHLGGDEVEYSCWESNAEIKEYMKKNNISNSAGLHALFMNKTSPLLAQNTTSIVWQEVYDKEVPLSGDTVVQVWQNGWVAKIANILKSGQRALFSTEWYLDYLGQDIPEMYKHDPRKEVQDFMKNDSLVHNIIGGEACMWAERVDDTNVVSRIWPRASAVAEVLWSSTDGSVTDAVRARIEEHTCRMRRRGVSAQPPSGAGFCV